MLSRALPFLFHRSDVTTRMPLAQILIKDQTTVPLG